MSKKILISALCLILTHSVFTQNLVNNPGFEEIQMEFPEKTSDLSSDMMYWRSATMTSPDIIRPNKNSDLFQFTPRNGKSVAGIFTYISDNDSKYRKFEYREYLKVKLTQKLIPNKKYYIEFWISVMSDAKLVSNNIGVYFTEKNESHLGLEPLVLKPQFNYSEMPDVEPNEWVKISGEILADKSYEYLTIGNFRTNKYTTIKERPEGTNLKGCYYLIDDVLVQEAKLSNETVVIKVPEKSKPKLKIEEKFLLVDKSFQMSNVNFEQNSSTFKLDSYSEMDDLISILKESLEIKILIKGHTDDVGKTDYNLNLSIARAKAVRDYLILKGIDNTRIDYSGLGESQPVSENITEQGRSENRRVEFEIIH